VLTEKQLGILDVSLGLVDTTWSLRHPVLLDQHLEFRWDILKVIRWYYACVKKIESSPKYLLWNKINFCLCSIFCSLHLHWL